MESHIYKVVVSDCLPGCPITTQEPLDRFALNFDRRTRENHGNVLSLVLDSKLSGSTFKAKILFPGKIDHMRGKRCE